MFKWKKRGQVFDPANLGENWMKEFAQAPSVIVLDDCVRVFFSSRPPRDEDGLYVSRLAYLDLDRENLLRIKDVARAPICPLGALGTFDEFGTYPASVIKVGGEVRAYHGGFTRCESVPFNAAIGLALSNDDGKSFRKAGDGPVLPCGPDEPFVMGSPKIRRFNGIWYLWYCAGKKWVDSGGQLQPVYKIRMARSPDGYEWTKVGRDLLGSVLEEDECQASADVFFLDGRYHMLFSYRCCLGFKEPGRGYRFGYASSTDLVNWTRDDAQAGMDTSPAGWDSESVSYGHVFALNGKHYMLYQGNEIGRRGFGLAELLDQSPEGKHA